MHQFHFQFKSVTVFFSSQYDLLFVVFFHPAIRLAVIALDVRKQRLFVFKILNEMNGSHCILYEISHSFYSNRRCLQATNLSQSASIHSPLFFHHFCLVKYFLNDFHQNNSHLDFKFNAFFSD